MNTSDRHRGTLCEWLEREYSDMLSKIVAMTRDRGVEHGFAIVGQPGNLTTTTIVSGDETSIQVMGGHVGGLETSTVTVHTHPSKSVVLSEADWDGFLKRAGLYPPGTEFSPGWRRGLVAVADVDDDPDTFTVRSVEVTPNGAGLSPEENAEWVNGALNILEVGPPASAKGPSKYDMLYSLPEVEVCTRTIAFTGGQ